MGPKYSTRVSPIMGGEVGGGCTGGQGMIWRRVAVCIRKFEITVTGRRVGWEKVKEKSGDMSPSSGKQCRYNYQRDYVSFVCLSAGLHWNYRTHIHKLQKDVTCVRKEPINCWCGSGSGGRSRNFSFELTLRDRSFIGMFSLPPENNTWILMKKWMRHV